MNCMFRSSTKFALPGMSSSCFGNECFESFFNSESLSDRILSIVEVEELCFISHSNGPVDVGIKRKHDDEEICTCNTKKTIREDDIEENCTSQFDEDEPVVVVENDNEVPDPLLGMEQENPEQEGTSGLESEQRSDLLPETENIVDQDLDLVDGPCEQLECKEEEVADQIDDVIEEAEKNDNEQEEIPANNDENAIDESSIASCSKQVCSKEEGSSAKLPEFFHPMHALFGGRVVKSDPAGNDCMHGDDIIEKRFLKETTVYVHSVILAAKSEYFTCLFSTSGMKETKQQTVRVEVGKGETENMLILLHCFYNKNFITTHPLQTVLNVCPLAMRYCYDGLIDKCLDVFRLRAETLTEVDDVNQIARMVAKIQSELHQHKEKCTKVMKTFGPFLIKTFYPLDVCLEKNPGKFFQLSLNSMYLLLDPMVQGRFNSDHGNLFVYAVQRWLKNHTHMLQNPTYKAEIIMFIESLLCGINSGININDLTGDFLTNIMTYEHCPFAIWPGYKEWYIKALQDFVYKYYACNNTLMEKQYPIIHRTRVLKFVRQDRNADIFSLTCPIILNGFEIGIYLRAREDRKVQIIGKCKNMVINKTGFDKASLTFNLKGTIKLNVDSHLWVEHFPSTQSNWHHEWLKFSYKQNLICLQMYGVCTLSPPVYSLAKASGFILALDLQQIR